MNTFEAVKQKAIDYPKIPQRLIRHLIKKGILTQFLDTEKDIEVLEFLKNTWADRTLLRAQLASLSKAERVSLIETAGLNRWEVYVFGRYKSTTRRLPLEMVVSEVELIFKFKVDGFAKRRIRQIRDRIHNARHYEKKKKNNNGSKGE